MDEDIANALKSYVLNTTNSVYEFHMVQYYFTKHDDPNVHISLREVLQKFQFGDNNYKIDFALYGSLLPSQSSEERTLLTIRTDDLTNYFIDFGQSTSDVNRGLWIIDNYCNRKFKLELPKFIEDALYISYILKDCTMYSYANEDTILRHISGVSLTDLQTNDLVPLTKLSSDFNESNATTYSMIGNVLPREKFSQDSVLHVKLHVTHYGIYVPVDVEAEPRFLVKDAHDVWYYVV